MEDEKEYKNPSVPLSNPCTPGLQNKELPIDETEKANPETRFRRTHSFLRRNKARTSSNYTWDLATVIEKPGGLESDRYSYSHEILWSATVS